MTVENYKRIYYVEWVHRMWGRTLGVVYAIPACYFLCMKYVPRCLKKRLLIFGGLIGFQGLLGWHMVKSGLNKDKNWSDGEVRVSPHRLAAHMGVATLLYVFMTWSTLTLLKRTTAVTALTKSSINYLKRLRFNTHICEISIFTTIISGSYVAGLKAGLVYNSWPKFADRWIPEDLFSKVPFLSNLSENPVTVQFIHRSMAYLTLLITANVAYLAHKCQGLSKQARFAKNSLVLAVCIQVCLGISLLLYQVPKHVALSHQTTAISAISCAVWLSHEIRKIPK